MLPRATERWRVPPSQCGMTTELQLELVTERPVPGVHAETPAGKITFGFSPDLNAAMGDALDAMLTWLQASYGVGKATAAGVGQPGARPEGHAGGEPVLGRSCAASGGRDQLTGGIVRRGTASASTRRRRPVAETVTLLPMLAHMYFLPSTSAEDVIGQPARASSRRSSTSTAAISAMPGWADRGASTPDHWCVGRSSAW